MIELTEDQKSVLKQGYPVRLLAPQLGGELIVVLAACQESTATVLQEAVDEIHDRAAVTESTRKSMNSWARENEF